ncbi:transcription termination/antitermination NusG family protein [Lachnospiraceae bacterium 54-53]
MWYVLSVKSGQEMNVASALSAKQFPACVPRENRLVRVNGSWDQKEYTLFPGYVFVNLTYTADNYYLVKDIPGVLRFLGPDGLHPSALSCLEAEWIRILSGGGTPLEPTLATEDEDGEIHLDDGVLQWFSTRIIKIDKHARRVKLELTVCGEKKTLPLSFRLLNDQEQTQESEQNETQNQETEQDPVTVTEG